MEILKKSFYLYFLILFLLCIASCNKENNIIIKGTVFDLTDNYAVGGSRVSLYTKVVNSNNYNAAFERIADTQTDEDGNYYFEIESKIYVQFKISVNSDNYYQKDEIFSAEDNVSEYVKNIFIAKKSFIKVLIKNIPPVNETDVLKLRLEDINPNCDACSGTDYMYFNGADIDTAVIFNVVGGENSIVKWISFHNGESSSAQKNINCIPGDTALVYCYY